MIAWATVVLVVYGLAGVGAGLLAGAAWVAVARLLSRYVVGLVWPEDAQLAQLARAAEAREQRAKGCEVGR